MERKGNMQNPKKCKCPKIFGHWPWILSLLADARSKGKFHIICEFLINPSSVPRSNPKYILIIFLVICYEYHHCLQMYNQKVSSEYRLTQCWKLLILEWSKFYRFVWLTVYTFVKVDRSGHGKFFSFWIIVVLERYPSRKLLINPTNIIVCWTIFSTIDTKPF